MSLTIESVRANGIHPKRAPTILTYLIALNEKLKNIDFCEYNQQITFISPVSKKPFEFTNSEYLNRLIYEHNRRVGDSTFTISFEELQKLVMLGIDHLREFIISNLKEHQIFRFEYIQNKEFKFIYIFSNTSTNDIFHVVDFDNGNDYHMSARDLFTTLVAHIVKYSESNKTTTMSRTKSAR